MFFWRLIPELVKCQQLNMTTCMKVSPVLRPYCRAFEARDAGGVEDEGEVPDQPRTEDGGVTRRAQLQSDLQLTPFRSRQAALCSPNPGTQGTRRSGG